MAANTVTYVLLGLTFCTWAVSISGIAAVSRQCDEDAVNGAGALAPVTEFSGKVLTCSKVHRFWWFVVAYEFIVIIAAIIVTAIGALRSQRASWIGLFSVATLLYIQGTNAYLSAQSVTYYEGGDNSKAISGARTATAGFVMTAVANCFVLLYIGTEREEAIDSNEKAETKAETI